MGVGMEGGGREECKQTHTKNFKYLFLFIYVFLSNSPIILKMRLGCRKQYKLYTTPQNAELPKLSLKTQFLTKRPPSPPPPRKRAI